jgi:hypothetical protein
MDKIPTKAWELISAPERWDQSGHLASSAYGYDVDCEGPSAVKWCPYGAMIKVYGSKKAQDLLEKIEHHFPPDGAIGPWNDSKDRTHTEVVELLKEYDI